MKKLLKVILVFLFLVISNITYAQRIESLFMYPLVYEDFYLENIDYEQKELVSNIFEMKDLNSNENDIIFLCTKGINRYPNSPTFYLLRGYFFLDHYNIQEAIDDLSKSIQIDPNFSPIAYYLRANAYSEIKQFEAACNDFKYFYKLVDTKNKCLQRNFKDRWYRHMMLYCISGAKSNVAYIEYLIYLTENDVRNRNTPYNPIYETINEMYKATITLIDNAIYAAKTSNDGIILFSVYPSVGRDISSFAKTEKYKIEGCGDKIRQLTILNNAKKY